MEKFRSAVRPSVQYVILLLMAFAFIYSMINFATAEEAKYLIGAVVALGVNMLGQWQGERKAKKES